MFYCCWFYLFLSNVYVSFWHPLTSLLKFSSFLRRLEFAFRLNHLRVPYRPAGHVTSLSLPSLTYKVSAGLWEVSSLLVTNRQPTEGTWVESKHFGD